MFDTLKGRSYVLS